MRNDSNGFVQIPIVLAVFISAIVFGGVGYYVAFKTEKPVSLTDVTAATSSIGSPLSETAPTETVAVVTNNKADVPVTVKADIEVAPVKVEVTASDFKQPVLESIQAQINSYRAISNWIDSDMIPLLSQRESMLNGLISATNGLMASETDSSVNAGYVAFIEAYDGDMKNIVRFYRDEVFGDIKNHINIQKMPALNSALAKFSGKVSVSEAEYNAEIQTLAQYQKDWQSLYEVTKIATTQFMSQTDTRDALYQRLWTDFSASVADAKKIQVLQSSLSQLYLQQPPRSLNCTFSSHFNGFGTVGSLNCY